MANNLFTDPKYGLDQSIPNYLLYSYAVNHNAIDLSNQIGNYKTLQTQLLQRNDLYDYSGNTLKLPNNRQPTILDAVNDDSRMLILQENAIYIIAFILMITFLILALMIGSE